MSGTVADVGKCADRAACGDTSQMTSLTGRERSTPEDRSMLGHALTGAFAASAR